MARAKRNPRPEPRPREEADALGLLGLARRAGAVVGGAANTRRAADAGELALALMAGDASQAQLHRLRGTLARTGVPVRWVSRRDVLGAALGGAPMSAAGIRQGTFAGPLSEILPEDPPDRPGGEERAEEQEKGSTHAGS